MSSAAARHAEPALEAVTVAELPASQPKVDAPILDTSVAKAKLDFAQILRTIARDHGKTFQQIVMEVARLSFGRGQAGFNEYIAFRLFDDKALAGADKTAFVGLDAARKIWATINYDTEWCGLVSNKLAATTLLGGYGFPVIPTMALFSNKLAIRNAPMLRTAAEFAAFLREPSRYPMFAKPMDSQRSLGAASFDAYDVANDTLVPAFGAPVPVDSFAEEVAETYGAGYLLQARLSPHTAMRAIVGERLATARILTIRSQGKTQVHRAVWKIPAGANTADNFWRGNLLASLDIETGRITRAFRGTGLVQEDCPTHPDTGVPLVGFQIPHWPEMKALACEAADVFGDVRLIGWDMACTDGGPVIVEPNCTPDFDMLQIADRRGMLQPDFVAFIEECKAAVRERKRAFRQQAMAETRSRLQSLGQSMHL